MERWLTGWMGSWIHCYIDVRLKRFMGGCIDCRMDSILMLHNSTLPCLYLPRLIPPQTILLCFTLPITTFFAHPCSCLALFLPFLRALAFPGPPLPWIPHIPYAVLHYLALFCLVFSGSVINLHRLAVTCLALPLGPSAGGIATALYSVLTIIMRSPTRKFKKYIYIYKSLHML